MKFILGLFSVVYLFFVSIKTVDVQDENIHRVEKQESVLVTFECHSCTKKNKFYISGPEEHTFKAVKFPLKIKLTPGEYEMTYWQNRIQQIHLPFDVSSGSKNRVTVKD